MAITVVLADDHRLMREGLRALLEAEDDIEVLAEADNGRAAVEAARRLKPEVVVMDVTMPDLNGIEATRQIASRCPETRVLALSMHSQKQFVVEMFRAGADGYLLKDSAYDELVAGIHSLAAGRRYLSPAVGEAVIEMAVAGGSPRPGDRHSVLTPREREVAQLLAEGHSTKEVAPRLHVSTSTIESHRRHIMEKLGVDSVAELTKYAIREGLTTLEP